MAQKSKPKTKRPVKSYAQRDEEKIKKLNKSIRKKPAKRKVKTVTIDEREQARSIEVYSVEDLIISELALPTPCEISLKLLRDSVVLQIGPRDWQWSRATGEFVGAGTDMTQAHSPVAEPDPNAEPVEGVVESDVEVFADDPEGDTEEEVPSEEEFSPERETSGDSEHLTDPNSVDDEKVG